MDIFKRSGLNPVLRPDPENYWESIKAYNPGLIYEKGRFHMFYRAAGPDRISRIGYAASADGENFKKRRRPVLEPESKTEKRGLEDPRITSLDKKYYMTYTAYDGQSARLFSAFSSDLFYWEKTGAMLKDWDAEKAASFLVSWDKAQDNPEAEKHWHKAGGIFPEKIENEYLMIFGDRNLWLGFSKNGINWSYIQKPFLAPRPGFFDSVHLEMGPPPVKTRQGWLVLYHGIDEKKVYRLGAVLLDSANPRRILKRSKKPLFEPRKDYELGGTIDITSGGFKRTENKQASSSGGYGAKLPAGQDLPQVIFCSGAALVKNDLYIFYGAGDSNVCQAKADAGFLLENIQN